MRADITGEQKPGRSFHAASPERMFYAVAVIERSAQGNANQVAQVARTPPAPANATNECAATSPCATATLEERPRPIVMSTELIPLHASPQGAFLPGNSRTITTPGAWVTASRSSKRLLPV